MDDLKAEAERLAGPHDVECDWLWGPKGTWPCDCSRTTRVGAILTALHAAEARGIRMAAALMATHAVGYTERGRGDLYLVENPVDRGKECSVRAAALRALADKVRGEG